MSCEGGFERGRRATAVVIDFVCQQLVLLVDLTESGFYACRLHASTCIMSVFLYPYFVPVCGCEAL